MNYLTRRLMGCGAALAILAVIGVGAAIYMGIVSLMHSNFEAPFQAQMARYAAGPTGPGAPGPVKGKMIVLDMGTRHVDWDVAYEMPPDLKAVKPEEVGTVVHVDWVKQLEANYSYGPGTSAYRQNCTVTVIDLASQGVIAKNQFTGGDPPSSIGGHDTEGVGPKPTKEVVAYLKNLPRQ